MICMKKLILFAFAILGYFASQAQKIEESLVPIPVLEAFQKLHSTIKPLKWEKEAENFEAEIDIKGIEISYLFDPIGNLLETETEISVKELPAAVVSGFKTKFPKGKIEEASKIENHLGEVTYEIEFNKVDYIFNSAGELLNSENDKKN
jgi:hypothetical protein